MTFKHVCPWIYTASTTLTMYLRLPFSIGYKCFHLNVTNCNIWVILGLCWCKFIILNKIWIGKTWVTWVTWQHQNFFSWKIRHWQMIVHLNPSLDHAKAEIMTQPANDFVTAVNFYSKLTKSHVFIPFVTVCSCENLYFCQMVL